MDTRAEDSCFSALEIESEQKPYVRYAVGRGFHFEEGAVTAAYAGNEVHSALETSVSEIEAVAIEARSGFSLEAAMAHAEGRTATHVWRPRGRTRHTRQIVENIQVDAERRR